MRFFLILSSLLLLCCSSSKQTSPPSNQDQQTRIPESDSTEIVFGISAGEGSLQFMTAQEFTKRANAALPSPYKVVLYPAGQLGKDKELMQKLRQGTVHLSLPSSIMSDYAPKSAIFDLPFLIKDRRHAQKIEKEIFWPLIEPQIEQRGYKVLGFWENGLRHISNNVRPIRSPEDLKGIKIRTPNSAWRQLMFKEWGATPVPMAFGEVYKALRRRNIDGQENPLTNIDAENLYEVQKYLSLSGHVYMPAYLTTGIDAWGNLPEQLRTILENTAREISPWMYRTAIEQEDRLSDMLEGRGLTVNVINREKFVAASRPIYKAFEESIEGGTQMIQQCRDLLQP